MNSLPTSRRSNQRSIFVAGMIVAGAAAASAAPQYDYLDRLGFPFRLDNGSVFSEVLGMSPTAGYTIGVSEDGITFESLEWGDVAWLGSPTGASTVIGLLGAPHVSSSQQRVSRPVEVNDNGVSIGYSVRFSGTAERGSTAWAANRFGATFQLGYYDAAHTSVIGSTTSRPVDLSRQNQIVGYSEGESDARTAWLAGPNGFFTRIGVISGGHTASGGQQWSTPIAINDSGTVAGRSRFYNGNIASIFGHSTWLRHPWGQLRFIGFQQGVHRSANGQHDGDIAFLSNSGFVAGASARYPAGGFFPNGSTAWITHVSGPNRSVGFYAGAHVGSNQAATSLVRDLNEAGIVAGESLQYTGDTATGSTAWLGSPQGQTVRVGLYSPAYTRAGRQNNFVVELNTTDSAIGYAERYDPVTGSNTNGQGGMDAWIANTAGQSGRLGLIDAAHTRSDGYRVSGPAGLIGARYVWGFSVRFQGTNDVGHTAWVYDRQTNAYATMQLSGSMPDEFWRSTVTHVLPSGVALLYINDPGQGFPDDAFVFTPGEGFEPLEDLVDYNIELDDFLNLAQVRFISPTGFVAGHGYAEGGQFAQGVFLLRQEQP